MKREIKFRAWNGERMVYDSDYENKRQLGAVLSNFETNLMQYTGLKDKNGKDIYEGDIVKYINNAGKEIIAEVEWRDGDGYYTFFNFNDPVDSDTTAKESMFCIQQDRLEIIGNIYENKQLLTL